MDSLLGWRGLVGMFLAWAALLEPAWVMAQAPAAKGAPPAAQAAAQPAAAAKFREFELGDKNAYKEKKRIKDEMLKGAMPFGNAVKEYYVAYVLPLMTKTDSPQWNNDAHREIFEDIDRAEKAGDAVMASYNTVLLELMQGLLSIHVQPSAQINAMIVLNRLNNSKPKSGLAPEPYRQATKIMLEQALGGRNDGIRGAAFAGLERHIELSKWEDNQKTFVAGKLFESLKAPPPPQRSPRADAWLRGRAIDCIMKLEVAQSQGPLYQLAIQYLTDPATDPLLIEKGLTIVGAYPPPEGLTAEAAKPALERTLVFFQNKANEWQKGVQTARAASGSDEGEETMTVEVETEETIDDGEGMRPKKKPKEVKKSDYEKQPRDIKVKRRSLHEPIELVRQGLIGTKLGEPPAEIKKGLGMLVPEGEAREVFAEVIKAIKELQDALNVPTITDRMLLDNETNPKMVQLNESIQYFLAVLNGEPAPAAPTGPVAADAPADGLTSIAP